MYRRNMKDTAETAKVIKQEDLEGTIHREMYSDIKY